MFKLRFHLANGPHKYKWQLKDSEGNVTYVDPAHANFTMTKCKLHNSPKVAEGIYAGKEKTVCSWIECENISIRLMFTAKDLLKYTPPERVRKLF